MFTQTLQKGGKKKKSSEKIVDKSFGKKKPDKEEKDKVWGTTLFVFFVFLVLVGYIMSPDHSDQMT